MRQIKWDSVPDSNSIEKGTYDFTINRIEVKGDDENTDDKLRYSVDVVVESEGTWKGSHHFQTIWIGSEEDPKAEEDKTWDAARKDLILLKQILNAAGVPKMDTDEQTFEAAKGYKFTSDISTYESAKTGKTYTNLRNPRPLGQVGGARPSQQPKANPFQ